MLAEPSEVGLKKKAQAVIIATGSEVQLALHAQAAAGASEGIAVRVVIDAQHHRLRPPDAWPTRRSVLPAGVPRIAVEAGVTDGWWKYGCAAVVGIDTLRRDRAPAPALFKHFGFTAENVAATVRKVLAS